MGRGTVRRASARSSAIFAQRAARCGRAAAPGPLLRGPARAQARRSRLEIAGELARGKVDEGVHRPTLYPYLLQSVVQPALDGRSTQTPAAKVRAMEAVEGDDPPPPASGGIELFAVAPGEDEAFLAAWGAEAPPGTMLLRALRDDEDLRFAAVPERGPDGGAFLLVRLEDSAGWERVRA